MIKAVLAGIFVFCFTGFTFWYGGLDLIARGPDQAFALWFSVMAGFFAFLPLFMIYLDDE